MIKKFILSLSLFFTLISVAQEGTSSPYSFFGIGDVRFKGDLENRSMGGVAVITDSIHLNLQNPAMLSNLKLTTFSIGGTFSPVVLKTSAQKEKAQRTTLNYLSVALPFQKFAVGFGLLPYSSVGYNIVNRSASNTVSFNGSGGVNKVYTSFSFKLTNNLNLGADIQYNFGEIETKNYSSATIEMSTRELNSSTVNGLNFNLGMSHKMKLNKKLSIHSGLTYSPEYNLRLTNTRNIAIVQFSSSAQEIVIDDIDVVVPNSKLIMPSKLSFGTSIGELKKWMIGTQITSQTSSSFGNRVVDFNNVKFEDGMKVAIGGYYIPKYTSFTSYISRITYRGGFRYENTGLVINNLSILDRALTLGVGLPLSGTFSNINIGFEFGKKGTKNAGLIEENYSNISVGFSFNDKWFQRRKFD
jgi:long-subunit fatty acid transport protein